MRSSYKRIGDYVQQVNARNSGLSVTNLQGVSINKYFMPSVANVNGTDLSTYKVVSKDQFAFNPMHVGRDEVLPIAILETDEPVIVSPAYVVFEIIDKQSLLPEYLMMWCRRPEFDRNAWFTTDSSVRGGFSWDDFCEMRLPVPKPEKQREIVKEYHTIVDRIKLNEQLNQKLEETAQAIYKQWFVDFEFPISAEYAAAICNPVLEGQPYKSSGGEMVFNEVLKQEIPKGWREDSFTGAHDIGGGGTPDTSNPNYWDGSIPFFTGKDVTKQFYTLKTEKSITSKGLAKSSARVYKFETTFLVARGATTGNTAIAGSDMAMNQSCYAIVSKDNSPYFTHLQTLYLMIRMKEQAIGGAIFNAIVTKDLEYEIVTIPDDTLKLRFEEIVSPMYRQMHIWGQASQLLENLRQILFSRIAGES